MSDVFVEKLFCGLECVYVSVQCYLCVCRVYSQCFSVTVCRECLFSVTHTSNVWIISVLSAEIDFSSFFGVVSSKASRSLLHLLGNRSDSFSFRPNWVYFISACVYQTSYLSGRIYMKAAELVLSLLETLLLTNTIRVISGETSIITTIHPLRHLQKYSHCECERLFSPHWSPDTCLSLLFSSFLFISSGQDKSNAWSYTRSEAALKSPLPEARNLPKSKRTEIYST